VQLRESFGSDVFAHLSVEEFKPLPAAIRSAALEAEAGETNGEGPRLPQVIARLPATTTVRSGDRITVEVEMGSVRLFDAESGEALPAMGRT
jgi:hypothetical protein